MNSHHQQITIAGMGATGKSIATFLQQNSIAVQCCDDLLDYEECGTELLSQPGFVFKSPGLKAEPYRNLPSSVQVVNDVELLSRMTQKPFILVTGTNGKSTVVALLEAILAACNLKAIACGNYGVPVLDAYLQRPDIYIIELSSYQLENLSSQSAASSVVLNIGVDHVDRYRDMNEYAEVKQTIHYHSSSTVVPVNDEGESSYGPDIIGYKAGDNFYRVQASGIYRNTNLFCNTEDLSLIGAHNHLNVCAVLGLLDRFNLPADVLLDVLQAFDGLPHRMEPVCTDQKGHLWINDSKSTNVHSTQAAMSSMREPVVLIMGGQGKGEDYSLLLSESSKQIRQLITFGKDAQLIDSQAESNQNRCVVETVSDAVSIAAEGDCPVLFSPACASFDQYKNYIERGDDFKKHVRELGIC